MQAAELFALGHTRAEVAARCGVSWRSAHEWHRVWSQEGVQALKAGNKPGPAPKFSEEDIARLAKELRRGPVAHGYDNDLWSLPRVGRLITETFQRKVSPSEVWRLLRRMRWSPQKPRRQARARDEEKIQAWKERRWPQLKARAGKEARTIVFVDESGLSQKPRPKAPGRRRGKPRCWNSTSTGRSFRSSAASRSRVSISSSMKTR